MPLVTYVCWKCHRSFRNEQDKVEDLGLKCPQCAEYGREITLIQKNESCGIQTDSTFMSGSHADDGFGTNDIARKYAMAVAKRAGVSVSGKRYCPNLARKKGDPRAWVDSKSHVKAVCASEGWGCEDLKIKQASDDTPDPLSQPYKVSEKLVTRYHRKAVQKIGAKNISPRESRELRTTIATQLSGKD